MGGGRRGATDGVNARRTYSRGLKWLSMSAWGTIAVRLRPRMVMLKFRDPTAVLHHKNSSKENWRNSCNIQHKYGQLVTLDVRGEQPAT